MRFPLIPCLLTVACVATAAEPKNLTPADFPDLPVTTGYLANTLMRGGGVDQQLFDPASTYLQLYTEDMVASREGNLYCTTTWEEGHRAAGVYRAGDALVDSPTFHTTSGKSVAVSERWLAYGQQGQVAVFPRTLPRIFDRYNGHIIRFHEGQDGPWATALALVDDTLLVVAGGRLYRIDLKANAVVPGSVPAPAFERMRLDSRGRLWGVVPAQSAGFTPVAVKATGDSTAEHVPADALSTANTETYWQYAGGAGGLVLDMGSAVRPAKLRFFGAGHNTSCKGATISGAASAAGPWTDLATVEHETGWWPQGTLTLDERPWSFLRIGSASPIALRGVEVQVRTAEVAGAVIAINQDGSEYARLPDVTHPVAITYDQDHDRLLVFDNGPDQQVHGFTGLDGAKPRRDTRWMNQGRFGMKGGLAAANGVFGPARFDLVRGLAVDGEGNLALFSVGGTGMSQSRLESYAPNGNLLWDLKGLAFLDASEPDPGDPNTAYSTVTRYVRDAAGHEGDGWRAVGTTLDWLKNKEDPRIHGAGAQVMGVRRIAGKPFLFITNQGSDPLTVFRFDAQGIAIPCAFFTSKATGSTFPPNEPMGYAWKVWQDANGDGQFQADEWRIGNHLAMHYFNIDMQGGVWMTDPGAKGIRHFAPAPALDVHGSVQYPQDQENLLPLPAPFEGDKIRGLEVAPDGKALFVFGFTPELPSTVGRNHPLGRLLLRLDLTGPVPTETHRVVLPYACEITPKAPDDIAYASSIAGDYLFVGYEQRMDSLVLRTSDLTPVGRIGIGPQSQAPIFDGPSELIAAKVGPVYELTMPMYTGNSTTVLRWDPTQTKRVATPQAPTATRQTADIALSWTAAAGCSRWLIQRRELAVGGWQAWHDLATITAPAYTDKKAPLTTAYRVRAADAAGTWSDWSATTWVR